MTMFLTTHVGLNNLGRGSPKEHSCQVILKSVQWFLTRRILKFSIQIYRENKPRPWRPCFLTIHNYLNNLGRGSPSNHFCKVILKSIHWFLKRRFFKFVLYRYIGKISPAPWRQCFFFFFF